ncbi:MAG: DUF3109 family protein [Anaerolineae bacterium]|nr:DUF3109 family protein [Anaerolineae bacterium]PKO01901.1 MAG: hypothetical protein CVU43_10690 [Chloroflexi bacterium HGW-Chloroflexi-5]
MNNLKNTLENRINPRMYDSEPLKRCCLEDCIGACCVFGVWIDPREVEDIIANASLILPTMPESAKNPGEWFVPVEDTDEHSPSGKVLHTAVENAPWHYGNTACVFCLTDGKCALQVAAVANNLHPWRFKPFYCLIHPIDQDELGRFTVDTVDALLAEKGSCLRASDETIPLIELFAPELEYLLGEKTYQALQEVAAEKRKG